MRKLLFILLLSTLTNANLIGQNPHRFDQDIERFAELSAPEGDGLVVFTGSSSIRVWEYLDNDCHGMQVLNTGFGGSHMSDLLYFLDQAVLRFKPAQVYIYEGDNDIAADKNPKAILETTKQVANKILKSNSEIKIHFINAKPSPSRWEYKNKYLEFNSLLMDYCDSHSQLFYVDVWNPMLDEKGLPMRDIFISDSLHMNRKGYLLWKEIICKESE